MRELGQLRSNRTKYTNHVRSSSDIMGPNRYIHSGITDKTSFLPEIGIKRILMFVTFIS